jgi:hypothetical protein
MTKGRRPVPPRVRRPYERCPKGQAQQMLKNEIL